MNDFVNLDDEAAKAKVLSADAPDEERFIARVYLRAYRHRCINTFSPMLGDADKMREKLSSIDSHIARLG